ncbi:MAG: DUF4974 domain-containing protein [Tannerella sp.]|jgi:ferric-dicitrate binding protein FerR (iron transport regulator)|nr:DUF4974 domain-containing protein [Tannerella sp.]
MLTIKNNNTDKWKLLMRVLSKDLSENDLMFQVWLKEDEANFKLYRSLKTGVSDDETLPDKDRMFDHIADALSFSSRGIPFFRKRSFYYVAVVLLVFVSGLTLFFITHKEDRAEQVAGIEEVDIFSPGTKKAYLFSSSGKSIDLSESFEVKKEDGIVISNKAEGVVCIQAKKEEAKKVENQTIYVPKGGEYTLILADSSIVYLNSETTLIFPSFFESDERRVELTGEAYFEIKKDKKPFIVQTTDVHIEVLGTSFNVNAYEDNVFTTATLVEGAVRVCASGMPDTISLMPGKKLNFDKETQEISIKTVDTSIYTAWIRGEFIFRKHPLGDILSQLSRWYDFSVRYEDPSIRNLTFTGSAEKARTLDYLLGLIESVTDIKYRNEDGTIVLYK